MMIGFDLDGVLCADMHKPENPTREQVLEIVQHRGKFRPLYYPKGDYVIITSRPNEDRQSTIEYIKEHFHQNPPLHIEVNPGKKLSRMESALFKYDACKKLGVSCFVESCEETAKYMRALVPATDTLQVVTLHMLLDVLLRPRLDM